MRWRAWLLVLLGGALVPWPWRLHLVPSPPGVLAILSAGPAPEEWQRFGLLAPMRDPTLEWRAANLAIIPGARGAQLWRRIETGMVAPAEVPSLLEVFGIPLHGSWSAAANPAQDIVSLEHAADDIERGRSAVVVLSCVAGGSGLEREECRAVIRSAVALLKQQAAGGRYAMFLAAPPEGAPAVGTIWVAGPQLKQSADFRFREIDLLPTVLYLSNLPIPPAVNGVPGLDLFSGEMIFHHPIEYTGGGS